MSGRLASTEQPTKHGYQVIKHFVFYYSGSVSQTVSHQRTYIINRGSVFYFSRRVPSDLKPQFNKNRITVSLRTRSRQKANKLAEVMSQRLELYWERIRLEKFHTKELGLELSNLVTREKSRQTLR